MFKDDDDDEEFINDDSGSEVSGEVNTSENSDEEVVRDYKTRSRRGEVSDEDDEVQEIIEAKQWYHEFISEDDRYNIELSGKMVLLTDILKECEAIGDKIIVFSQSLLALDAIEDILQYCDRQPVSDLDKDRDVLGRWVKGIDYFRMDGTTNAGFRKNYINMFNNPANVRARLFLISTRAGSLGTNLVGANRVIVFDTSWNPSHDVQAIFRVYRFGQIKPVYIYRFLAQGTMEEKIYDRQVTKLSLSCRVVDEQQIERHFSAADLAELYTFDRNSTTNRPTPMLPKDRLLAEMLIKNKEWIVTYHEHDSLLQNQTEEDLTEEERQAAWTEYENEREGKTTNIDGGIPTGTNAFCSEPDFTSEDYEGQKIPDLRTIMETLYIELTKQMPGQNNSLEFRKKLLVAVFKVRQVFQEKHVKVLRLKQEYVAHGNVPNAVNKYMEELSKAIQSTGEYIQKLQKNIEQDEIKEKSNEHHWQEQLKRMQQNPHAFRGINLQSLLMQNRQARPGQPPVRFPFRMAMPQNAFINQRFVYANPRPMYRSNSRSQNVSKPTITEVDENVSEPAASTSNTTSNTKSTVIIEEIP